MDPRKYQSGASASPPAPLASPSDGYPRSGDPGTGTPATVPGAYWHHMISEELRNVIVGAGLTPDYEDLTQFSQAIQVYISGLAPKIKGLVVTTNSSDPDHDIDIGAGSYGLAVIASAITKRLDAAFSPGTGNGGMVGSLPVSGVVYVFLIRNGSSIDVYAETTNGGNPPSGWTIVKRIAVRPTDASGNLLRVLVSGSGERLTVYPYISQADWSVSSLSTSRVAYPIGSVLSCPPNVDAYISHHISSSTTTYLLLSSLDSSPDSPTATMNSLRISAEGTQDSTVTPVKVNSSRQVGVRASVSSISDIYYGQVLCWIEDRS